MKKAQEIPQNNDNNIIDSVTTTFSFIAFITSLFIFIGSFI
ncbi:MULTISPECIES: hypothetical protein [Polaribacter]|nr:MULTISPECIES: hypothetical protein [Polaribacter]MDO6741338.1 hypothetical protein [Polaribacter sp. 1_MG-2023]